MNLPLHFLPAPLLIPLLLAASMRLLHPGILDEAVREVRDGNDQEQHAYPVEDVCKRTSGDNKKPGA